MLSYLFLPSLLISQITQLQLLTNSPTYSHKLNFHSSQSLVENYRLTNLKKISEVDLEFDYDLGYKYFDNLAFKSKEKTRIRTSFYQGDNLKINLSTSSFSGNYLPQDISINQHLFKTKTNIDKLSYRISFNQNLNLTLSLIGNEINSPDYLSNQPNINFISRFSRKNPLYRLIEEGGITLSYNFSDNLIVNAGYYAGELKDEQPLNTFLNNDSSFVMQIQGKPNEAVTLGFLYIYSANDNNLKTQTGSNRSQLNLQRPIQASSYGFDAAFRVTSQISIGGWLGLTQANILDVGEAEIWNYAITIGINDVHIKGDFLGIIIGQEPKLTSTNGFTTNQHRSDNCTSVLGEILYHYPLGKNVSLTSSFIVITAPDHNVNNKPNFIFTLRTQIKL